MSYLRPIRLHLTSEFHHVDFHSLFSFPCSSVRYIILQSEPFNLLEHLFISLVVLVLVVSTALFIFGVVSLHTKAVVACWSNRPVVISLHSMAISLFFSPGRVVWISRLLPLLVFQLPLGYLPNFESTCQTIMTLLSCVPTSYIHIIFPYLSCICWILTFFKFGYLG